MENLLEKVKQRVGHREKRILLLVGGPIVLVLVSLLFVLPQLLTAVVPSTEIPGKGLPSDMELTLTIEASVDDLDKNYFMSQITMSLGIEQNSTRQTSYDIHIIPAGLESGLYGVSVPFQNLESDDWYYSYDPMTGEWITYNRYTHSGDYRVPIIQRVLETFPGDFYESSTFYVWFDGAFYPNIKLSLTSSVPKGFIITFTQPKLMNSTYVFQNVLEPIQRIFIGKPSHDILTFEIVIQRDFKALIMFLFYDVFLLIVVYEVFVISKMKIEDSKDRLKIFVGLAIAVFAFLWSIRQVTNIVTWPEILIASILGFWLALEAKGAMKT